jgi:hypothetical protein
MMGCDFVASALFDWDSKGHRRGAVQSRHARRPQVCAGLHCAQRRTCGNEGANKVQRSAQVRGCSTIKQSVLVRYASAWSHALRLVIPTLPTAGARLPSLLGPGGVMRRKVLWQAGYSSMLARLAFAPLLFALSPVPRPVRPAPWPLAPASAVDSRRYKSASVQVDCQRLKTKPFTLKLFQPPRAWQPRAQADVHWRSSE